MRFAGWMFLTGAFWWQGQHSAALDQLSQAVQLAPAEALPRLLLGITHATAALSRKTPDRDRAVLLAFTFLQARTPQDSLSVGRRSCM